jgi:hypothetical protein
MRRHVRAFSGGLVSHFIEKWVENGLLGASLDLRAEAALQHACLKASEMPIPVLIDTEPMHAANALGRTSFTNPCSVRSNKWEYLSQLPYRPLAVPQEAVDAVIKGVTENVGSSDGPAPALLQWMEELKR